MEITVTVPSEVSRAFIQGMANRMAMSFYKYGPVAAAKGKVDELASLKKRIERYETTRNTEWLMDVANFAMIIYMHEGSSNFRATDSDESPGLVTASGETLKDRHTETPAPLNHTDKLDKSLESSFYNRKGD